MEAARLPRPPSACPPARELELLLVEALDEAARMRIETHVESCAKCQSRLEELSVVEELGLRNALRAWGRVADGESAGAATNPFDHRLRGGLEHELARGAADRHAKPRALEPFTEPAPGSFPRFEGYEIEREIGRGAVGIVYRARHRELDRLVALKVILAGPYSSPRARRRFRAESQAIARLRHPRIVQVYEIGEQDGCLYLALELVEGGNLAASIAEGPLPAAKAARIVAELAEAVEHAHENGVIHRDLKPANVLFHDPARGAKALAPARSDLESACELKITDFGLAKVAYEDGSDDHDLTQSGEFLGTPSYTAPEQARGDAKLVGPAADVYSLGAILYELVTGRPPFQAPSVVETLMQVAHHDAVPPALLVPGLSRDLDTICTRCLAKDPAKRFESAAALAADLRRFLGGEPILARRVGRIERAVRWVRRRPARALLVAGAALAGLAFVGTITWTEVRAAALERDVDAHLGEVARRADDADWSAARTALERAKTRSEAGGRERVRERVADLGREFDLVARLDAIRLERAALADGKYDERENDTRADRAYAAAFAAAGLDSGDEQPSVVAARIRASHVRRALVAALDDWALRSFRPDDARRARLMEIARLSDPASNAWLDRVRTPEAWKDPSELEELARTFAEARPTVEMLVAIGQAMDDAGLDAIPFLESVQQEHPDDFWANLALADALQWKLSEDSVRYYQAALALRPQAAVVHNNLGRALATTGSTSVATAHFRRALALDPSFAEAHMNHGSALSFEGRHHEAYVEGLLSVQLAPQVPSAHSNLGRTLMQLGRVEEAIAAFEEAICVDPLHTTSHTNLCSALITAGRIDDAIEHGEIARGLAPRETGPAYNLGLAFHAKGRFEKAAECFQAVIAIAPGETKARGHLAETLRERGRFDEALAIADEGLRLDPSCATCLSVRGKTLAMANRLPEAMEDFQAALSVAPMDARMHHNLAIALHASKRIDEAIVHYDRAVALDPKFARTHITVAQAHMASRRWAEGLAAARRYLAVGGDDPWTQTVRELVEICEHALAAGPRFEAVVAGSEPPLDARDALLGARACMILVLPEEAAPLFAHAFEADASLPADATSGDGLQGALAAIRLAQRLGERGASVADEQPTAWRARALAWLTAALHSREERADAGGEAERRRLAREMVSWVSSPILAAVRGEKALEALPEAEREPWRSLWARARALQSRGSQAR